VTNGRFPSTETVLAGGLPRSHDVDDAPSGLGLPICQEIARAHGGGIDVAPRQPNGTVFCVELPVHALQTH
jgi:K+-sensing histidine kinase KdpD